MFDDDKHDERDGDSLEAVKTAELDHKEYAHGVEPIETAELPTHLAENVSYGKSGIPGLMGSPYVLLASFLASLGGFSFGYDQGVISIINVMPQFLEAFPRLDPGNSTAAFWKGLNTALLELGCVVGCIFMPWLCDRISRKWAITVVVSFFCVGGIIQTAAVNYGMLAFGRFFGGIGVGTLALGAPLYISEVSPPNLRGTLLVLESISIVSGVSISFWITYGTRYLEGEIAFRLPFGLQLVSASILGVVIHFFPYSPRWLVMVGRNNEALEALGKLRRLPTDDRRVQTEWKGIMAEDELTRIIQEKTHPGKKGLKLEMSLWADLFKKKTWRRTVVAVGVAFFQQFSGINAFIYYAPTLFQSLGADYEMSLILSGVMNIIQLIAVLVCFVVIDNVGRRPLAIWGAILACGCYMVIAGLVGSFSDDWRAHTAGGWAAVAMAFLFMFFYGVSYSPLGWCLPSEVYSTAQRSKGVALATATVWLGNFIVGLITPPMIEGAGFGTYIFFGGWCGLAAVWAYFLVPETKGKTLEEMDAVFGDNSGAMEKEILKQAVGHARRNSAVAAESRRASAAGNTKDFA